MQNAFEYRVIDKEEFLSEYKKMKPVILGKGKIIAENAGVAYHTYRNAVSGKINNPAVLGSIIRSCLSIYQEILDRYSKIEIPSNDKKH